ncbi:MAG TPA: DUF4342 domain-containing protein [Trueperaceae bacterium]
MDDTERENAQTNGQESTQDARKETFQEEFKVTSDRVVAKVKELIREGNVRRIIIKNEKGKVLLEFPLLIGVAGAVLLHVWAALAVIAALVSNLSITVERQVDSQNGAGSAPVPPSERS